MGSFYKKPAAAACVRGGIQTPLLSGTVKFYPVGGGTLVVVHVKGLPEETGFLALHIHEGPSCTGVDFADTGSHYNPTEAPHPFHAGDLPPLLNCRGHAWMSVWTDRFRPWDVMGRTVVIHSGPDDFHTQPAGNAGTKLACGVIRQ